MSSYVVIIRVWMVCLQAYAIKNGLESWIESWTWKALHVPVLPRCWKQLAVGSRFAHLPSLLARLHRVCPWTLCQQCYWLHLCQRSTNLRNFTFDGMTFFMTLLSQGHPKLSQFKDVGPGSGQSFFLVFKTHPEQIRNTWKHLFGHHGTPRQS